MTTRHLDSDPRNLVRWWGGGDEPPRIAVWEITLACDLACHHCGSRAGRKRPDELSTTESLDVVEQLARLGIREVSLIGGEAYLRDDWVDIAHAITEAGMTCTMVTGGRGFDDWRLEEAMAAGIKHISVSIDGLGATHDAQRGAPGAFESAVDAVRRIAATNAITVGVNTQINRLSLPELPALARLLVELGVISWQIQLTVALGRAADRPDMLLQPYHLLDLFPMLVDIKRETLDPGGVQLAPGNNIGYFGPHEAELRYGGERGHAWSGCAAGRASLGLEADGKVKGCPSLPSEAYTGGNVRDLSIEDIRTSTPELTALSRRTVDDLWGFCRTCEHAERCLAGCTWTAHALFGRPGNNPYCHHRAVTLAQRGLRERVRLVEAAPGRPFDHGRFELVLEPLSATAPDDGPEDRIGGMGRLMHYLGASPTDGIWRDETLRDVRRKKKPAAPAAGGTHD